MGLAIRAIVTSTDEGLLHCEELPLLGNNLAPS